MAILATAKRQMEQRQLSTESWRRERLPSRLPLFGYRDTRREGKKKFMEN
jgi:hypothetical protein